MVLKTEEISYEVEGVLMRSRFYVDEALPGPRPCVLVYPDARGLDDVSYGAARRLAEDGYAALACDFYGNGRYIADPQEAIPFARAFVGNPQAMTIGGHAAVRAVSSRPAVDASKLAAMGYCLGGNVAVELARSGLPLAAAIGFHGGAVPPNPERSANIKAKILLCLGANDPMIPLQMRSRFEEDMIAADVDWRMHLYGRVYHAFTKPNAGDMNMPENRYDKGAEERSWSEMKSLLKEVFG